jgi:hypothetical protein
MNTKEEQKEKMACNNQTGRESFTHELRMMPLTTLASKHARCTFATFGEKVRLMKKLAIFT